MLRVQTSFQDTPGDGHYFVLLHEGRDLKPQLEDLGLQQGDSILLWEPDCGGHTVEAILLVDYQHPMMPGPALWARAKKMSD